MRGRSRDVSTFAFVTMVASFALVPLVHGGGLAHADTPPSAPSPYPTCGTKSPTSDDVAAAKKTFELGNRYLAEADYDRAILYFGDAYRSDCTAHKLLGFIARSYELRGDRAEAVRALETYLERAPRGDDRPTVERRIANLKAQITSQPTATASAAASAAPPTTSAAPAPPPPPVVVVSPRGHTIYPWIVVGTGVALAAGGAVVAIVGKGKISDGEDACPGRACATQALADDGNSGRSQATVGVVLAGVGVAAIAGGLIWHFAEPTSARTSDATTRRLNVTPAVAPGYAGGVVQGRF